MSPIPFIDMALGFVHRCNPRLSCPNLLVAAILLLGIEVDCSCASAADAEMIAAAKQEGQVVWYTTQIVNQFSRPAAEAFQRKYGIRVNYVRGDSVELAARLLSEGRAGRTQADVFDGTAVVTSVKREGLVLQWIPESAERLPMRYRDPYGYWVATNEFIHTPAFNTALIRKGEEPKTFQDLLDPKWNGRMVWAAHATTSGAAGFIGLVLHDMGEAAGIDYLRQLARQNIVAVGGSTRSVVDQVIAGEYPMVLQAFNHQAVLSARRGAPIDWIPMNPAMGVLSVAGVMKGAGHPNAAKLLVDFFISEEGQRLFQAGDYIPVDRTIEPREPRLRPDGRDFRAIYFTPEAIDVAVPHWQQLFKDIFH